MREVSQLAIGAKVVDVGKGAKGAGEVAKFIEDGAELVRWGGAASYQYYQLPSFLCGWKVVAREGFACWG